MKNNKRLILKECNFHNFDLNINIDKVNVVSTVHSYSARITDIVGEPQLSTVGNVQ